MRNLKKFLALVLAMMMALSLMVTANAASDNVTYPDSDIVLDQFEDAVTVLSGMGVLRGNNGSFKPQDKIMRCEAVAILYRLVTSDVKDTQVDLYKPLATSFSDVKETDWFAGYVGFAVDAKLINGYNGKFMPTKNVTGYEMLKMLLKAVGYGQNGEYTGSLWRINVGSDAQRLGILTNINSTHYANTLAQKSPREVVADLTFQTAAYVPTVRYELGYYNPWVGVASGQGGNIPNPTLGQREFGLTRQTGIVVGNQATGEIYTKVGVVANPYADAAGNVVGVNLTQNGSYVYATDTASTLAVTAPTNVTLSYNFGTGLDYYGHKVDTWYDSRTSLGTQQVGVTATDKFASAGYNRTYAILDKAELVKTVFADNALLNANSATSAINLLDAAQANGFTGANKAWTAAFMSDRYSQFSSARDNDDTIKSKVGIYTLISNGANLDVDVAIVLNQEVAVINQRNSTVKNGEYIFLGTKNSSFGSQLAGQGTAGEIFDSQLSPESVKTLGTLVTAHQIVGTNDNAVVFTGGTAKDRDYTAVGGNTTADAPNCWYQTDKLEPAFTGTISTYTLGTTDIKGKWIAQQNAVAENIVTSVTLSDSKSYPLSGITGSQYEYGFDTTDSHLINGVTALTDVNTYAGVTYTFYTDAVGRFIGVGIPNDYKFLYTTFADYEIGALGTGTSGYYAYGVDWNGQIVKTDNQISSITLPVTAGAPDTFDEKTPGTSATYPNATQSLAEGYNLLPVTLKDQGSLGSPVGNQIRAGLNYRFMMDPNGNLTYYSEGSDYGHRFVNWYDETGSAVSTTWTITSGDAANGFKRVYNQETVTGTAAAAAATTGNNVDYLLTNDTEFIVVTGSGTADLSVKTYKGLTELLNGGTSVEISSGFDNATTAQTGDCVYFLTTADQYGNTNVTDNRTITKVILSDTNLTGFSTQTLFFAAPGAAATGVKLAGTADTNINQYVLWNNGVKSTYFVKDNASGGVAATGTAVTGDFYTLAQISTVNGTPIYKAVKVTDAANSNHVAATYDYVVVNNMSTAEITCGTHTTWGGVFKVTGASVTEVFGTNTPVITTNTIDSLEKLNHAVSMGKGNGSSGDLYTVSVAIVYSGVDVSTIYITNIA